VIFEPSLAHTVNCLLPVFHVIGRTM
jgi:hypothetical protein